MNLTTKAPRDFLGPVNPNLNQQVDSTGRQASRDKEPVQSLEKKGNVNAKVEELLATIESLTAENDSMNAMIRTKNQEISNLKLLLKASGGNQQVKNVKEVYFLNGLPIETDSGAQRSVELDRAIYLIKALTKERDDLKRQCEQFSKGAVITEVPQAVDKSQAKLIEQYEEHIASLSSRLSTVQKLENDITQLNQERSIILQDFQNMRGQLINRIGYCEHLENQLRHLEYELNQRNPATIVNPQIQVKLSKVESLEMEVTKLKGQVAEKDEKILEIQINKSGTIQVTKEAFQSMQSNINSLQEKLNTATENHRKQLEKATNLQIQLNKVNRQFGEKLGKNHIEKEKLDKLESEKIELNNSLQRAKIDLKQMEKKYEDVKFDYGQLKIQHEKSKKQLALSQELVSEVEKYKRLAQESSEIYNSMVNQITKIEGQYQRIKKENQECRDLVAESKAKWQQYDKLMKKQSEYIIKLNDACSKRLEEVDKNIEKNINLQNKIKELQSINDPLNSEINVFLQQNKYIEASQMAY